MKFACKVRKRTNGSFEARVCIDGVNYSATSKTSSDAVNKLKDKIFNRSEEQSKEKTMTYGKWIESWYKNYKVPNLKESSLYGIEVIIRLHIPERIKKMEMTSIKSSMLLEILQSVERSRTRQLVYCVIRDSFDKAFKNEIIEKDVSLMLDPVKHHKNIGQALSLEERESFLETIKGHKTETFFKFCLFSGVRRNEGLSSRWSDIDFQNNVMRIRGTKTIGSFRTIPLFEDLRELVLQMNLSGDELLFNFNPDYVTKTFHNFCPGHKLHDLRHTFATRAMECGIAIPVVSKWLGHTNIDTTARVYTHVLDNHQMQEAKKFKMF